MSEPEFGAPCPSCTSVLITTQIERFPTAYTTCRACRDHGALFHAEKTQRNREDAQKRTRGQSGRQNGTAHG